MRGLESCFGLSSSLALGIVAGLRSQLPLALLSWEIRKHAESGDLTAFPIVVKSPWFVPLAATLAVGELIGDKLPMTPSRLKPGPLVGRFIFGGLAGAAAASLARQSPALGAMTGALGALLGSFGGYYARKTVVEATGLPDPVVAVAEDAVAVGIGAWAILTVPQ